jgi:hypothetical protein
MPNQATFQGDGLAFVDLDGDGDPDLVLLGRNDGLVGVYENDGAGFFANRSYDSGIGFLTLNSGIAAADYDDDSDPDLYITRQLTRNVLLRNDGDFTFTDVAAAAGVDDDRFAGGPSWGDFDGDGRLDLFVPNRPFTEGTTNKNLLYRNLGDGTFEEVGAQHGVDSPGYGSFQGTFLDYDVDGDLDLYVIANHGYCQAPDYAHSHLFENVAGQLVDVTEASGADACGVDAMSIATGDFDNNGGLDLYVTNIPFAAGHALLMNQLDGTFQRDEQIAGVQCMLTGWGAEFFDLDHDGYLDLYVCNVGENRLYRHEGVWPCTDIAATMGVNTTGSSYAVASADVDGDGDLDLAVGTRNAFVQLFINHAADGRWAKFDVVGEGARREAIGATARVRTGAQWRMRQVIAGNNYKTQNDLVLHFGLDEATVIDEVEVLWPGGTMRTVTGVPTDARWALHPPSKLGDGDGDGDRDADDAWLLQGCRTDLAGGGLTPGCERMDFDGDWDVEADDLDALLAIFDGPLLDCDGDGAIDLVQILDGTAADADLDGRIDACVVGDATGDGVVDIDDVLALALAWGPCPAPCQVDVDGNGSIDVDDIVLVALSWS